MGSDVCEFQCDFPGSHKISGNKMGKYGLFGWCCVTVWAVWLLTDRRHMVEKAGKGGNTVISMLRAAYGVFQ
jgi:hypothetical protein